MVLTQIKNTLSNIHVDFSGCWAMRAVIKGYVLPSYER